METTRTNDRLVSAAVLGGCLMLGLVLGGLLLGMQIKETKLSDRYVTVKGLVEQTVKSDSAIWPVTFKETGNDLQQVYAKSEEDRGAVLKFFFSTGDYAAGDCGWADSGNGQDGQRVRRQ